MENFAAISCQKLFSHGLTKSSAELFFSELLGPPFFQKVLMENFATISCQKLFSCGLIESSAELFFSELLDTPFFQKVLMENFDAISCQKLFGRQKGLFFGRRVGCVCFCGLNGCKGTNSIGASASCDAFLKRRHPGTLGSIRLCLFEHSGRTPMESSRRPSWPC